ncbi:MAG: 30S ribosome-binding factor RbfA [Verrucomicrobiota bacterium]|jgi:ribosome-binding factor A|nr:ribosome-binding factor A [Opitutae bacterium]MBO25732.1 ribosome-binding factor A [Opitutales bacterium]MEC7400601.1 30S ribosome-binding factor RbfA [Verrucomicrobiota bacterium]MEC8655287.1 30S ribosome-binding factor RbfA [Verrucomicrobiota bacterium]MEC8791237.1 30S ribosome-binding factor RbfA [Verrucomicrobiota bacterium]|tara:strand:- start:145 stop:516 length:372 start_codon:yes stop_codon:yes gene_type:complete
MSLRLARVNELIKREIGTYLSTRYRSESVRWTITSVDVSADLRNASVGYSVLGEELHAREAQLFFRKHAGEIRKVVSKQVILKYSPRLQFVRDLGIERGNRVMEILDELDSGNLPNDDPENSP